MTLIRNDKLFNLFSKTDNTAKKEFKEFKDKFPWFKPKVGLKINMAKRFKRQSNNAHNRAQGHIDKPASIRFGCKFNVMTSDGPVSLMYCERYETNSLGAIEKPFPTRFRIVDDMTIGWEKVDFAYFLHQHTGCGNGPNFDPRVMGEVFRIEEPEKEAQDELEIEMLISKVHNLILHEPVDNGMDRGELERIAHSYQLKLDYNHEPKKNKHLRKDILHVLKLKAARNGIAKEYNLFLKNLDRKDEMELLGDINFAIENGIIKIKGIQPGSPEMEKGNMVWQLMDVDGQIKRKFAYHRKTKAFMDHNEFLLKAFKEDTELFTEFKAAVQREQSVV